MYEQDGAVEIASCVDLMDLGLIPTLPVTTWVTSGNLPNSLSLGFLIFKMG